MDFYLNAWLMRESKYHAETFSFFADHVIDREAFRQRCVVYLLLLHYSMRSCVYHPGTATNACDQSVLHGDSVRIHCRTSQNFSSSEILHFWRKWKLGFSLLFCTVGLFECDLNWLPGGFGATCACRGLCILGGQEENSHRLLAGWRNSRRNASFPTNGRKPPGI